MCRWLVYKGDPIFISDLVLGSGHSLIDQSMNARESVNTTNGDGFGIGWYGERSVPGVYRDVYPAWNDRNLISIAEQVRSGLFVAHIRAATGTPIQRTNSHPFQHDRWLFQHNGLIPEFRACKHEVYTRIDPRFAGEILGSTDSELLFYLALTYGLETDPETAFVRTIDAVEQIRRERGIAKPFHFTAAATDGDEVHCVRYSSEGAIPRTLYHTLGTDDVCSLLPSRADQPDRGIVVASEPLDDARDLWEAVPISSMLRIDAKGRVSVRSIASRLAPA